MSYTYFRQNFFSLCYFVTKTSVGFLLHPYLTMSALFQTPQRHPALTFFFVLTPGIYYALAVFLWRLILRELVSFFLTANCPLMLIKTSAVFFALYWQLSLLYLFSKFNFQTQKGSHDRSP